MAMRRVARIPCMHIHMILGLSCVCTASAQRVLVPARGCVQVAVLASERFAQRNIERQIKAGKVQVGAVHYTHLLASMGNQYVRKVCPTIFIRSLCLHTSLSQVA